MGKHTRLKVVSQATDDELASIAKRLLQYGFGDYIPDKILDEFEITFNASSYSTIITTSAPKRLCTVKTGVAYHDAYVDLMQLCTYFTTRAERRP